MRTVASKAAGRTARWNSLPGAPPISCSACPMAAASAAAPDPVLANESRRRNAFPGFACGLAHPEFGDRLAGMLTELFIAQVPAG